MVESKMRFELTTCAFSAKSITTFLELILTTMRGPHRRISNLSYSATHKALLAEKY